MAPLAYACLFYPVFVLIGLQNSFAVAAGGLYRWLFPVSALLLMFFFCAVLRVSTQRQRLLFLLGTFVCAFGENLCVHLLDLYHFAGADTPPYSIPPYVILGHGYAIWTAVVLAERFDKTFGTPRSIRTLLAISAAVTLGRAALNQDWAGLAWLPLAVLPYALSIRPEDKLLLATTYALATGLELLGVGVGAWEWHSPGNPPAAVGSFYVLADWVTLALLRRFRLAGETRPARQLTPAA